MKAILSLAVIAITVLTLTGCGYAGHNLVPSDTGLGTLDPRPQTKQEIYDNLIEANRLLQSSGSTIRIEAY